MSSCMPMSLMQNSIVKERMARGETVICAKAAYTDPEIIEIMGNLGYHGIWICLEHKKIDAVMLDSMIRACRVSGADAIIRLKPSNHSDLIPVLECGARGIMLPQVKSPDEVRWVVEQMKFYPEGRRSLDNVHAESAFGLVPAQEFMEHANRNNYLLVQIEVPEVAEHIDEIASIDGADVLFVGPADLTNNMGLLGQMEHPRVQEVLKQVINACRKHGKVAAITCGSIEEAKAYRDMGFGFLVGGSDYRFLMKGLKQNLAEFREAGFAI